MSINTLCRGRAQSSDALWAHTDRSSGCWLWLGAKDTHGYGYLQRHTWRDDAGKRHMVWAKAHRLSWGFANGREIPDGLCVCHSCDTPACINPDHLFLGTKADNNADKDRKGRGHYERRRGAGNPNARLTIDDVRAIRGMSGSLTQQVIADRFRVAQAYISRVVRHKVWIEV